MDQGESFPEGPRGEVWRSLDTALSCTICYSLLDVPLMLRSCGHSFCSACIRPNLEFQERKGQPCCPSCRKPCDARDLQVNVSLRDAVERYRAARPLALQLLRGRLERERRQQEEEAGVQQRQQPQGQGKAGRGPKRGAQAAAGGGAASKRGQQQQPSGDQRSKLRPRPQQRPAERAGNTQGGSRGKSPASGPRHQVQAGRKRQRRSAKGEGGSQHSGSGSDFVVAIDDSSSSSGWEEEGGEGEESRGSQGEVEAIDLVDSDSSSGSDLGLSDAESLSPPAKRVRRQAGSRQSQRRWAAAAGASGGRQTSKTPCGRTPGSAAARKKEQQQQQRTPSEQAGDDDEEGIVDGGATAPPDTPNGFVRCPICSKTVPEFYINSHVDTCLACGGASHGGAGSKHQPRGNSLQGMLGSQDPGKGRPGPSQAPPQPAAAPAAPPQPFAPLAVPSKLVPSLTTDKAVRSFLAKYGLPTDGKKKEMLDRYSAFRLAVMTANDRQERTTYAALARRISRQRAAAGPAGAVAGALLRMQPQHAAAAAPAVVAAGPAGGSNGEAAMAGASHTFKALIAGIRARKAAKKAAQEAAAAQAAPAAAGAGAAAEPSDVGAAIQVPQQLQQEAGNLKEGGMVGQQLQQGDGDAQGQLGAEPPPQADPLGHWPAGTAAGAEGGSSEGYAEPAAASDAGTLVGDRAERPMALADAEQAQQEKPGTPHLPSQAVHSAAQPPQQGGQQEQQAQRVEAGPQQPLPSALSMLHRHSTPSGAAPAHAEPTAQGSACQRQHDAAPAPLQAAQAAAGASHPAGTPAQAWGGSWWGGDHQKEQLPPNSRHAQSGEPHLSHHAPCQASGHPAPAEALCQQQQQQQPHLQYQQCANQLPQHAGQVVGQPMPNCGHNAMLEVLAADYIPDSDDDW